MQEKLENARFSGLDLWLLLGWLAIGTILRFTNLANKPASSIEIATLGFSLGHSFSAIPLDELVSVSTLLSPLKLDLTINSADIINRLFTESTHPPLYFWLTHWWIKLFTSDGELVSLQVGRSLSAIIGGLAIPAMFGLSWLAFRDRLMAHLTAILMALSPYGIYLAQEARHYTLSILWIIASLSCMLVAIQHIYHRRQISWWICLVWIVINSLGMATHYFFSLALGLEVLVIGGFWFWQQIEGKQCSFSYWLPIIVAGLGSLAGCLVWLPVASSISSNELTDWIETSYDLDEIWQPIPRSLGWLTTMVILLPLEKVPTAIAICSLIIIVSSLIWAIFPLIRGYTALLNSPKGFSLTLFSGYGLGAIILYLFLIYGYGKDVSLAARYHFVYFPVVVLILAATLAQLCHLPFWKQDNNQLKWFDRKGRKIVTVILLISSIGSLTVVNNLGYRKSRDANRLAAQIETTSTAPVVIATTYETLSQLRESIALALALETNSQPSQAVAPQYLLLRRNEQHDRILDNILFSLPKPLDMWGVNLRDNQIHLNHINCIEEDRASLPDSGYNIDVYHCRRVVRK